MSRHAVPFAIYGQNLTAGLFFTLVCAGSARRPRLLGRRGAVILSAGLLLATFADAGLNGVHRWVVVGPIRIHAGAMGLPVLILALGEALARPAGKSMKWLAPLLGVAVTGLLLLQPDAAEASAFAGAFLVLLFSRPMLWVERAAALGAVVCAAWSWMRPDPLSPVPYVEGIVGLAAESGAFWLAAALLSLALLPCPFFLGRKRDGEASPKALALGVYFAIKMIAPCFGPFPVPMLGFGLSPIVGYFVALTWLLSVSTTPARRDSEATVSPGSGGAESA